MEGLKSQIIQALFGARSLVWFQRVCFFDRLIRHQPSELGIPGSNPGAPATPNFSLVSYSKLRGTTLMICQRSFQLPEGKDIQGVHDASNDIVDNHNSSPFLDNQDMNNYNFPCFFQRYKFCRSFHGSSRARS